MWAAGFLYGLGLGKDLRECGRYGSILGGAVVQQQGTAIPEMQWNKILKQIKCNDPLSTVASASCATFHGSVPLFICAIFAHFVPLV